MFVLVGANFGEANLGWGNFGANPKILDIMAQNYRIVAQQAWTMEHPCNKHGTAHRYGVKTKAAESSSRRGDVCSPD